MNEFILTLIVLGIELVVAFVSLIVSIGAEKTKKIIPFIIFIGDLTTLIITYLNMQIPPPEIYPSNGQISEDGNVSIHALKGLGIYYTLDAYLDPNKEGKEYTKKFKIDNSVTINAKTNFLTKWSECVTLDLIVGEDGSVDGNKTSQPGTSIESITAVWAIDHLYAGFIPNEKNIKVEGKTINGEIIPIKDFSFTPNTALTEGKNVLTITYNNLRTNLESNVDKPQLISIQAEVIGKKIKEGSPYTKKQFKVIGKYEDGSENQIKDFIITPKIAEKYGKNTVIITKDGIKTDVTVKVSSLGPMPLSSAKLARLEDVQGYMINNNSKTLRGDGFPDSYIATSAGTAYDEVISVCSFTPFELIYNLEEKYDKLSGDIAFDDISSSQNNLFGITSEFQGEAEIIFYVDDNEKKKISLATSDFPKSFSINVRGGKKLSIVFSFPYYNFALDNFTKYFNIIDAYLKKNNK